MDQTIAETLNVVARRLGVEVTCQGKLYYIGSLRRQDRAVLVRRVRRLSAAELRSCVSVVSSDQGSIAAFEDGLLVIGDRVEVLSRIDELLTQVENADCATWVVQLYLVSLEDAALRELGLDARPSLEVAATFAAASAGGPGADGLLALNGGLNAVLEAAASDGSAHMVAEPLFFLGDGGESVHKLGQNVPVPERSVSSEGTVTTVGYDNVQTGLICSVGLREVSADSARIKLDLSLSEIVGFVEEVPRTSEAGYKTEAHIESGGVYLLGSLVRQTQSARQLGGFRSSWIQESTDSVLQIWARAYRVGSAAQHSEGMPSVKPTIEQLPAPAVP
jgi:type II secretory pathway component GspD/PulD (secretin)